MKGFEGDFTNHESGENDTGSGDMSIATDTGTASSISEEPPSFCGPSWHSTGDTSAEGGASTSNLSDETVPSASEEIPLSPKDTSQLKNE